MLALWRVRVGSGFIKAQATKALGDGAVTHSPRVCVHKHTSMHTGSTAVFGQSNLACDLFG